ncbi:MAG: radical SAM protein, partial [Deltaproteobacteria bacterium]|nr:radical SAM protein [Deltaproteobacteria bacterium]
MSRKPDFPLHLSIQTTSLCNASCIFCPSPEIKNIFPPKIMERNLFSKIIRECKVHKEIKAINLFMNNEPLTDPYIIERIHRVKKKVPWANVNIFTNGLLLTDELGDKLIGSKLNWINISFHGIRETTIQKSMGTPYKTTLDRINKFIEKAKETKYLNSFIGINFLKHKYLTDEEIEEAMEYWKSKGIEQISCFLGPISRAGNVSSLPKIYNQSKIVGCSSVLEDDMIHINEDGIVTLCCMDWRREVVLGDLKNQSIHEIWNGKRKEVWEMIYGRAEMPGGFLCRRCEEAVVSREHRNTHDNPDVLLVTLPPRRLKTMSIGLKFLASRLNAYHTRVEMLDLNLSVFNRVVDSQKTLWRPKNQNEWQYKESFKRLIEKQGMRESINFCIKS